MVILTVLIGIQNMVISHLCFGVFTAPNGTFHVDAKSDPMVIEEEDFSFEEHPWYCHEGRPFSVPVSGYLNQLRRRENVAMRIELREECWGWHMSLDQPGSTKEVTGNVGG